MKNILITGGSGLLGKLLIKELENQGHNVAVLSRNPDRIKNVKAFYWDIKKQDIDKKCLEGIDTIVHLAGAGIADEKWTEKRKKELIDSRVNSIELLYRLMAETKSSVESIISASAVGYYGDRNDEILFEESVKGNGFLPDCCEQWESAVDKGLELGLRIVKLRIGLLLTPKGGVLEPFLKMVNSFTAMKFGNGQQWMPWIHADDLVGIFSKAINEYQITGVFNASAPSPVRNKEFVKILSKVLRKPFWPAAVPGFFFGILLGERKELVLMSNHTSARRIQDNGFEFKYIDLKDALEDLMQ